MGGTKNNETIDVIRPKPYERIADRFVIFGYIPRSWIKTDFNTIDARVFIDFLDINGQTTGGTTTEIKLNWFSKFKRKLKFSKGVQINRIDTAPYVLESQGRITIRLSGCNKDCSFFLPIIIDGFEPKSGVDPEIEKKHKDLGNKVLQYENDLQNYRKEWNEIRGGIVYDKEITKGVFDILEKSENNFEAFSESEEDKQEQALEEKYKDALRWKRPLRGIVGRMDGFTFSVYSGDHGNHFHVVHKGRGINARFSFPQIELINYKQSVNIIGSKEKERIRKYYTNSENFQRLANEFKKRL